PDRAIGAHFRPGEDAGQLHDERGPRAVVVRGFAPPDPVHVAADDVHLPGVRRSDLGAVHLFALARRAGLRVERAQPGVGLLERIGVDAGPGADTAVAAAPYSADRVAQPDAFRWRHWRARLILVLQARHV